MSGGLVSLDLPGVPRLRGGKVREVFDLGDRLLLVATDRISAFDCVLPDPIPGKGVVLNTLSAFWFEKLDFVPNHVIETRAAAFPAQLAPWREILDGRSMLVKKCEPLPVECVVRGYLAGSGWEEYRASGTVGGHALPGGLRMADRLPEPLFTPARKASSGHDENITWKQCRALVGDELALRLREASLELYEHGRAHAARCGIVLADTKFEFGLFGGELVLIDECLTPDSSRFWAAESVVPGTSPPSFDKQFVRDYLNSLDWDKTPPAPRLPAEIIARTAEKYQEALLRLTGRRV
ncbi:MAG: phosphoribosylaminoimidazolesuccinocarboxamide synthase [Terrimicrobiaceae bacterium]|nr:phosphoribosylaminoimidazolesuccinocarboxamide synthase [Terrimicrobiaceae bacterium]